MARNATLLATGFAVLALTFAGCAGNPDGDGYNDPEGGSTSTGTESASGPSSCATISPNSPGEENCQAAGIPGRTSNPDRCGRFTASPTPGGILEGTFGPYCDDAVATTYNTALIPDESVAIVTVGETPEDTTVQLQAQSFAANTTFSARLHRDDCGEDPADAGPEYQGPQGGLVLDFTTDAAGTATAGTTVPWTLPDDGAESLLILDAGQGGAAGNPVGCINLEP
ncbi:MULTISPECIES: hypothetical protein [unclassified Arthrobacter]|uniref:hypothetical protein n=1 Tax=unclassified Arthrobacter TaxID=235627 RepID=UPI001E4C2F4B|nr:MULTISPECIES: hypothetical protein [unclassified Arthrobacter]MCC9146156.1 hypothetical protein [Arthrobacter sp. zg-Y919]MDK1277386.1 hypothetical protein [Arthrobacter sp. zg.Y919]WIB03883.1 hypothetical protein QNO10_04225 [Arthrobacter sp. zg-Y919]